MSWLSDHLRTCELTEEVEGYLLGRGAKEPTIRELGIVTWHPLAEPAPDEDFRLRYGKQGLGEKIDGYLVVPVYSPKGMLIGFEARNIHKKAISDYRMPEAKWCPFFIGTRQALPKLWAGGDVWLVEGLFDLCPLEWVIPERDAVLATVRAHLGVTQLEFLRRYCTGQVRMTYDRDATGRKAIVGWKDENGKQRPGALELLRRVGLRGVDVPYLGGKDPGEIWDHGGVPALQRAFANPLR